MPWPWPCRRTPRRAGSTPTAGARASSCCRRPRRATRGSRLAAQRAALASARGGAAERDLVVVEAVGTGPDAAALRRRLGLPAAGFRAVLVGKDGGAKLTSDEPVPPRALFATIDAMPMRRDEMRRPRRAD